MKGSINSRVIFPRDPGALFTTGEYRGRSLADWMANFARSDAAWIQLRRPRGRPAGVPRKLSQSERFLDYQRYRGDARDWRMVRLSERVGAR